jgi:pyrimidine operon attenuation protein/uracil phosphoribosyltransferase
MTLTRQSLTFGVQTVKPCVLPIQTTSRLAMIQPDTITLMSPARVRRTVERMAFQIAEQHPRDPVLLVGVNRKGQALAEALQKVLLSRMNAAVSVIGLEASLVMSSSASAGAESQAGAGAESHAEAGAESHAARTTDLDNAFDRIRRHAGPVILVDDVIFTGRTLHHVVRWLPDSAEMTSLSICVLIDRGHREVPLHPAITGLTLPTKQGEHIEVRMRGDIADAGFGDVVLTSNFS